MAGGSADAEGHMRDAADMRHLRIRPTRSEAVQQLVDAVLALSANRDPANVPRHLDTSRAFAAPRFTVRTSKRRAA
jgi:hypothetical protein